MAVVLQTADEAGDVKTGCVRLSTSAPLRLITSGEAGKRRRRAGSDRPRLGFQQSACITGLGKYYVGPVGAVGR